MAKMIGSEAAIQNAALMPLEFLVGEWRTEGVHPVLPASRSLAAFSHSA
jgi:hypothetical protein